MRLAILSFNQKVQFYIAWSERREFTVLKSTSRVAYIANVFNVW